MSSGDRVYRALGCNQEIESIEPSDVIRRQVVYRALGCHQETGRVYRALGCHQETGRVYRALGCHQETGRVYRALGSCVTNCLYCGSCFVILNAMFMNVSTKYRRVLAHNTSQFRKMFAVKRLAAVVPSGTTLLM